jgi:(p)ppGpp synthase/HD superfamily hydrolase
MLKVTSEPARVVATLHDVVEDSDVTLDDLRRAGFADEVLVAVDALTRRKGESYTRYVRRAALHPLALQVKIADLEDNMDLRRRSGLEKKDKARMARYRKAYLYLMRISCTKRRN